MKYLSILQPYATLIALGKKHIENRMFSTNYRGDIAIHAGKRHFPDMFEAARKQCERFNIPFPADSEFQYGGIVGVAKLTGIVYINVDDELDGVHGDLKDDWLNFWNRDAYGWVLEKQKPLKLIPMKGNIGLRDLPPEIKIPTSKKPR